MNPLANDQTRQAIRERYGKVAQTDDANCCSTTASCCEPSVDAKAASMQMGYSSADVNQVPQGANMGLGCGNPKAIAALQPGETVLDLGSGGGFDCFLAVQEVGQSGRVIGVDMTPEMITKARANADAAGHANVDFRLGEIENLPVADSMIDVIISNCVINLSPDKPQVFREAYRVLKPGGRLAISDVVSTAELPESAKRDLSLLAGCMSGAASIEQTQSMLQNAGFQAIDIQPKDESKQFIREWEPGSKMEDYVVSATIEAVKPVV